MSKYQISPDSNRDLLAENAAFINFFGLWNAGNSASSKLCLHRHRLTRLRLVHQDEVLRVAFVIQRVPRFHRHAHAEQPRLAPSSNARADGHSGGCIQFGLTNSYIRVADNDNLNPTNLTLEACIII